MPKNVGLGDLAKVIKYLRSKLPLSRIKVKVLYEIYGDIGKRLSYVRPCSECYDYGKGWPCNCLEIVLVPEERKNIKYSLMHEWGHIYLGDSVDLTFAATVPCEGYEGPLSDIMKDVDGYSIVGLACDTVVDYAVSKRIEEYKKYITKSIKEQVEDLSEINNSEEELVSEDALICTHLATLYVGSKALGLGDLASKITRCLKGFNCDINTNSLDDIVDALRKEDYLYAYEKLLNILLEKYLNSRIHFIDTSEIDPLTGRSISYKCIILENKSIKM